jgi:hypothetical protein
MRSYCIPVSYFEHLDRCLLSSVLFSVEYLAASGGLAFVVCVAFRIYYDLRQWILSLVVSLDSPSSSNHFIG